MSGACQCCEPTLNDSRWRTDTYAAPSGLKWVLWNHGGGKKVVGVLQRTITRTDDVEAWMPFETT